MQQMSAQRSHGGTQYVYRHASTATGTDMTFALFLPPHREGERLPLLTYLSGLTCTHANVMEKGEYRRLASELGVAILCPDTSPRGEDVPDDLNYDLGQGAGFYCDATAEPWAANYRMRTYVEDELPALVGANFAVDMDRQSIFGHSMGGHGALVTALRNPNRYRSLSAIAPICAPMQCDWGRKALTAYLGSESVAWRDYDSVALIEDGARFPEILVDQGGEDEFLHQRLLRPDLLEKACAEAGIPLTLNIRDGYDHSYYFISTVMDDHLRWHAERLKS